MGGGGGGGGSSRRREAVKVVRSGGGGGGVGMSPWMGGGGMERGHLLRSAAVLPKPWAGAQRSREVTSEADVKRLASGPSGPMALATVNPLTVPPGPQASQPRLGRPVTQPRTHLPNPLHPLRIGRTGS